MKFFLKIRVLGTALVWTAGFCALSPVWADSPSDYLRERTYVGVVGTSISVDKSGLFSGLNYSRINTPYEIDLIPALQQNFGYGVLVGHREEAWAVDFSFWQSHHNATFGPGTVGSITGATATLNQQYHDTAVYDSVNIDFKRYFLTELQIQPFLNLGVSFPWITVQDAAVDQFGNVAPLTLGGLGLDLGLGVEYYVSPSFSLIAGAYERWTSFDQFSGLTSQFNQLSLNGTSTSDAGSGLIFTLGTTVGFE